MRASACLDPQDSVRGQGSGTGQEFRIFLRINVIRDSSDVVPLTHILAQSIHECGLAAPDRPADADPKRTMRRCGHVNSPEQSYDRNSRVDWVSWRIAAISERKAHPPMSSSKRSLVADATLSTTGSSAAKTRNP